MGETITMNTVKDYSMCLRDDVENFTKELINGVFDEHYQLIHIENTKQKFLKILERLAISEGEVLWNEFKNSFIKSDIY